VSIKAAAETPVELDETAKWRIFKSTGSNPRWYATRKQWEFRTDGSATLVAATRAHLLELIAEQNRRDTQP
jgi:hypothetical protein